MSEINLIKELRDQLRQANEILSNKNFKNNNFEWPEHNKPESNLGNIYGLITKNEIENALNILNGADLISVSGESYYLKGLCYLRLKDFQKSVENFQKAKENKFSTPYVAFNEAESYKFLGRHENAILLYKSALKLFPAFSECRHNYALLLRDSGKLLQAELQFRLNLIYQSDCFLSSFELGNLLREQKKIDEAIECYKLCLNINPKYIPAILNLGICFQEKGNLKKSIYFYQQCLTINPNYLLARNNLIHTFNQTKEHQKALEHAEFVYKMLSKNENKAEIIIKYINILLNLDDYNKALKIANSEKNKLSRLLARLLVLPIIYKSNKELNSIRKRWVADLYKLHSFLHAESIEPIDLENINQYLWSTSNFYLCYQMQDDRELQIVYNQIIIKLIKIKNYPLLAYQWNKAINEKKIRIGIVSCHLYNHNGSNWAPGLLESFAGNSEYEIYSYNLSEKEDHITKKFASLGKYKKLNSGNENFLTVVNTIRNDCLDLLIFSDIGMHPTSKILSTLKLAKVQFNCWGHPITSGSAVIDYFLSSELMETESSENYYSEKLIRLPSIGLNYPVPITPKEGHYLFEKYNISKSKTILSSLQSPFKYVPENDWIFAEISKKSKNSLIIFVEGTPNKLISQKLIERISLKYKELNLDVNDHIMLLPRLNHADYMGFLSISHHTLDTVNHNGGNSSLQAFSVDCPVVTYPTDFMRGRHTYAMLKEMEVDELIASTKEEYIELSLKLLEDQKFYLGIKDKISKNKHKLFNNKNVSTFFKKFVEKNCI